jgi:hypothetical protein
VVTGSNPVSPTWGAMPGPLKPAGEPAICVAEWATCLAFWAKLFERTAIASVG